jgi:hypothetical protein
MASPTERRSIAIILEESEQSIHTSSRQSCLCNQQKRLRIDNEKLHLIQDESEEEEPAKKRARFCSKDCCKQEFVESIRAAVRNVL